MLEFHQGIQASLPAAEEVVHLFVDAREAEEYFSWSKSSAERIKEQFPNLKKLLIEDDYLSQKQIAELPGYLEPVVVEWTYGLYIDGRHGR